MLPLVEMLEQFVEFRRDVVRRRTEFELRKAEARAHVLEGLKIALDHLDAVIALRGREPSVVHFGHWAAHGFGMVRGAVCLDGGCYAGGALWALRLGDGAVFHQPNAG